MNAPPNPYEGFREETHPESALRPATCDTCGNGNMIDGYKIGCAECVTWLDALYEATGTDLRPAS